jgi:hypothetical protein
MRYASDDMPRSTKAFMELVWPKIGPLVGGGELLPVEGRQDYVCQRLDADAGIDFLQCVGGLEYGIAGRAQGGHNYPTFTIRHGRPSGRSTELQKRMLQCRAPGCVKPHWTIQGYYSGSSLLQAAAVRTDDLYRYVEQHLGELEVVPISDGSASMMVAEWERLHEANIDLRIWRPPSIGVSGNIGVQQQQQQRIGPAPVSISVMIKIQQDPVLKDIFFGGQK